MQDEACLLQTASPRLLPALRRQSSNESLIFSQLDPEEETMREDGFYRWNATVAYGLVARTSADVGPWHQAKFNSRLHTSAALPAIFTRDEEVSEADIELHPSAAKCAALRTRAGQLAARPFMRCCLQSAGAAEEGPLLSLAHAA